MANLIQTLANAYAYIRSQEVNQSTAAITLDHLIQAKISSLKAGEVTHITDSQGQSVGDKPSRYDSLTQLSDSMNLVVTALKNAGNDPDKLATLGLEPESN